jgi:hypothetical protein
MRNRTPISILSFPALLWDGEKQLSGRLELWKNTVIFHLSAFKASHLSLVIPLAAIEKVEEYLVFDLARNGLRIQNKNGKYDLFVPEDARIFKKALQEQLKHLK